MTLNQCDGPNQSNFEFKQIMGIISAQPVKQNLKKKMMSKTVQIVQFQNVFDIPKLGYLVYHPHCFYLRIIFFYLKVW